MPLRRLLLPLFVVAIVRPRLLLAAEEPAAARRRMLTWVDGVVITVDSRERFGCREVAPADPVRRTRCVAWSVGVVAVLLSTVVWAISGNLLEIAFEVTNLLVAPLFGLFFMTPFVPWATSFGTLLGAAFGLATVVSINYWQDFTGEAGIGFLWAMPLGLTVQATAGSPASLLPIGRHRPSDDTSQ